MSNSGLVRSSKPWRKGRLTTWAAQFQRLHPLLQHLPHPSLLQCRNVGFHVVLWAWCRNIVVMASISHPKHRWPSKPRRMRHTWWNEWPEDRLWALHGTSTYALVTLWSTVLGGVLAKYIYSNANSNHFKSHTIIWEYTSHSCFGWYLPQLQLILFCVVELNRYALCCAVLSADCYKTIQNELLHTRMGMLKCFVFSYSHLGW